MTIKILLVEDDHLQQLMGKTILSSVCDQLDTASTGNEAIEKIKNGKYDLVFMDIGLPDINGIEVTRKIREHDKITPIVALTAHDADEKKEEALAAGMNEYMAKPVTIEKAHDVFSRFIKNSQK